MSAGTRDGDDIALAPRDVIASPKAGRGPTGPGGCLQTKMEHTQRMADRGSNPFPTIRPGSCFSGHVLNRLFIGTENGDRGSAVDHIRVNESCAANAAIYGVRGRMVIPHIPIKIGRSGLPPGDSIALSMVQEKQPRTIRPRQWRMQQGTP